MAPVAEQNTHQVQELLIRLERNNKVIQRLSKKLTSYTCEPNNPSCFEKLYEIKNDFKVFGAYHEHIMEELQNANTNKTTELNRKIELHLEVYNLIFFL